MILNIRMVSPTKTNSGQEIGAETGTMRCMAREPPGLWGGNMTAGNAVGYGGKVSVGRTITVSHWNMPLPGDDFYLWNAFHH